MKYTSSLFILAIALTGCNVNDIGNVSVPGTPSDPSSTPAPSATPVATATPAAGAISISVNFGSYSGFSDTNKAKAQRASVILAQVLSSAAFRDRVLAFSWNGSQQFTSTNLTNAEVYDTIIAAKESYNLVENHSVDLNLNLYTPSIFNKWGTVGYTYENSDQIFTNIYYFNSFTEGEIAAHLAHEWTHKLGFEHDYNSTTIRPYSVPYAIGTIVEDVAKQF